MLSVGSAPAVDDFVAEFLVEIRRETVMTERGFRRRLTTHLIRFFV